MADNITISQGVGTSVATDDVGGVQYQRVKVSWGVDGAAVDASASNPFPITVSNSSLAVTGTFWQATQPISASSLPLPSGASTSANQSTVIASLGATTDAAVANGSAGSALGYLRQIKDQVTDTTTDSPVIVHTPVTNAALTPTLDTSAYASGDVLFVATALAAARATDKCFQIDSLAVVDKDDQKPAIRLLYFSAAVTFGTINAAPSISDADAANYLGHIDIAATDYVDLGGVSVASLTPACGTAWRVGPMKPASGTTNIYVAAMVTAGTPTHTASGLVFNHGIVQA